MTPGLTAQFDVSVGKKIGPSPYFGIDWSCLGDSGMSPILANSRNELIHTGDSFANRFCDFEWKYLCSHQWFQKGLEQALETNDFSSLEIEAEMALADAHLRGSVEQLEDELSVCHSADWYE
jgi:hypothetical protein